jgi:hypothetical protein
VSRELNAVFPISTNDYATPFYIDFCPLNFLFNLKRLSLIIGGKTFIDECIQRTRNCDIFKSKTNN